LPTSRVNAIIGPSGSGKTTLLNFLSGRLELNGLTASGHIFFNSHPITDMLAFRQEIAYVTQEDVLLPTLTVRETIQFAANLRLDASGEDRVRRVQQLI
jgi:ABC-type multidrug transport system ATPase subunit